MDWFLIKHRVQEPDEEALVAEALQVLDRETMTVEGADSGKTLEVTIWAARLTSQGLEVALGPKRQSFLRFVVPVLVGVLLAAVPTGFLWSHLWTALGLTALMGVTHLYFRRQFRRERAKLRRLFLESLGASFPQKSSKHP